MTLRVLALDAALARCSAAVVTDGAVVASRTEDTDRGHAALLPVMVRDVLEEADNPALDFVAVTVGPGSFTGIRAGLALAHGIALGCGVPAIAVTVGEALAAMLPPLPNRILWTATDSRHGRVFLEIGDKIEAYALTALPVPAGPVAIAGDASIQVTARLAARNYDVLLTNARLPLPLGVALAGAARFAGKLPPREAQPVYVDPPEAKLPAGGLRPPPLA
jgi:tRNA threonylcarbamoyladenosine biosynthesis protein TsaB